MIEQAGGRKRINVKENEKKNTRSWAWVIGMVCLLRPHIPISIIIIIHWSAHRHTCGNMYYVYWEIARLKIANNAIVRGARLVHVGCNLNNHIQTHDMVSLIQYRAQNISIKNHLKFISIENEFSFHYFVILSYLHLLHIKLCNGTGV